MSFKRKLLKPWIVRYFLCYTLKIQSLALFSVGACHLLYQCKMLPTCMVEQSSNFILGKELQRCSAIMVVLAPNIRQLVSICNILLLVHWKENLAGSIDFKHRTYECTQFLMYKAEEGRESSLPTNPVNIISNKSQQANFRGLKQFRKHSNNEILNEAS